MTGAAAGSAAPVASRHFRTATPLRYPVGVLSDGERSSIDDIIEVYKRDADRTLIRESLSRSPEERLAALGALQRFSAELTRAAKRR